MSSDFCTTYLPYLTLPTYDDGNYESSVTFLAPWRSPRRQRTWPSWRRVGEATDCKITLPYLTLPYLTLILILGTRRTVTELNSIEKVMALRSLPYLSHDFSCCACWWVFVFQLSWFLIRRPSGSVSTKVR